MASAIERQPDSFDHSPKGDVERRDSIARTEKGRWERLWPVIACGAGLFSDGYLNNVRIHSPRNHFPARQQYPMQQYHLAVEMKADNSE